MESARRNAREAHHLHVLDYMTDLDAPPGAWYLWEQVGKHTEAHRGASEMHKTQVTMLPARSESAALQMRGARIRRAGIVANHMRKGRSAGVQARTRIDNWLPALSPRRCPVSTSLIGIQ